MEARSDDVQRQVLPGPDRTPVGLTTYDAKDPDTAYPPIRPLRPPDGAPNVLVVLLDDVGFGRARNAVCRHCRDDGILAAARVPSWPIKSSSSSAAG